jgi:hypothetical protein
MRLTTVLALIAGLLIAGVVALVVFLRSIDLTEHRDLIVDAVREATGRDLVLAGEAKLTVSFTPTVVIGDVSLTNAAWGSGPWMLAAKRVEAQVELLPLLIGKINIKRLVLVEPEVALETDARGRGNWEFESMAEAGSGGGDAVIPDVGAMIVSDGRLTYRDGQSGETWELLLHRFNAHADSMSSPLSIAFAGEYQGQGIEIEGTLGPLARLTSGEPYAVDLRGEAAGAKIAILGEIRQALAGEGFNFAIDAQGDDLRSLSAFAGRELPETGPYAVRFRMTDSDGRLEVSDISGELGARKEAFIAVTGSIRDVLAGAGLDLKLTVEARDTAALAAISGVDVPSLGRLALTARVADRDGGYVLEDANATIGATTIAGRAKVDVTKAPPRIEIVLTSPRFDLGALLAAKSPPAPADQEDAGNADRVFSDDRIPFEALGAVNGVFSLHIERVVIGDAEFKDAAVSVDLESGSLTLDLRNADYGAAKLSATMTIDAAQPSPVLAAKATTTELDLGRLLTEMHVTDLVEGEAQVALDLRGEGPSVRAIMAGLDGHASLVMGQGRIGSDYVDLLAADLVQAVAPWSPDDGDTKVNCLVGRFGVVDGLATSQGILFDTQRMTVVGTGTVNLASEKLDLIFKPKPKDPSLFSLATPIRLGGTLAKPSAAPDTMAVAKTAAGAVLGAIATGGIGLIVPFVSMGSGDDNPCLAALAKASQPLQPEAEGGQTPDKGLGGVLKGVGGAIGGFLGGGN